MTMIRQRLFTGLLLSLLVSLFVATAAEAAEPNEAQVLSRRSQSQHHANTYRKNETASLIAEPTTSADAEVEVLNLRQTDNADTSELEWPWSDKKNDSNKEDRTCKHYANCSTCSDASWCHWCGKDCHVIGSVHGCFTAASCDKPEKKNETDPSGCGLHDSCGECSISSHLCHWCAHDNACHSVGSYYGCVNGVDCYSNDICKRKEPEAITDTVFTMIGPLPLLVLVTLSALLVCCASTCFCVASGVKGAYDDLAGIHADARGPSEPLLQPQQQQSRIPIAETPEPVTTTAAADADAEQVGGEENTNTADDSAQMVRSEEGNNATEYVSFADDSGEGTTGEDAPLLVVPPQQQQTRRRPFHMQRLYNACTVCYIVTVAVIVGSLYGTVHYFPSKPVYNICNDNVAWKSLIDSMASMKVSADFEILASVNNPNYFDVELDMGKSSSSRKYTAKQRSKLDRPWRCIFGSLYKVHGFTDLVLFLFCHVL
jgi:hypothetical protein